jgi:hypothetical protein
MPSPPSAAGIYPELMARLDGRFGSPHPRVLDESYSMLALAARSFDSGHHYAAGLCCRTAVEAGAYLFLARQRVGDRIFYLVWPRNKRGEFQKVIFDKLLDEIEERNLLAPELLAKARAIQEHGNYVAHFASRQDEEMSRWMETLAVNEPAAVPSEGPMYGWPSMAAVLEDLEAACEVLFALTVTWSEGLGGPRVPVVGKQLKK